MGEIRDNLKRNLGYYLSLNKISQKELADALNVSQAAVTNWIKGKNSPDIELVAQICRIFRIDVTDLMGMKNQHATTESEAEDDWERQLLIDNFDAMNIAGQEELVKYSKLLLNDPQYRACAQFDSGKETA